MPDLAGELRRRIEAAGDPRRAPDMQAYMKSDLPYAGVTSVPLRAILREVIPAHPLPDRPSWEAAVRGIWAGATYREEWYAALGVARHRLYRDHQDVATLGLYRELIIDGAWWDVVDDLATHLVGDILAAHREEATPVLCAWAVDDDLWLRRTAVICQIGHKHDTDLDLLRHALEQNLEGSPHGRTFWIRKAVGWALRQHARTDPDWVRAFVAEHETGPARLSGLSRREALKHL